MTILVTGGAGYVGTELVERLTANPAVEDIIVYDNLARNCYGLFLGQRPEGASKVRFVEGEVLDTRGLARVMDGVDVVYHLAANVTTPFANTDPHFFEQTNHWGTAQVVEVADQARVGRLIYASSMAVYGASNEVVSETSEPHPSTYYGMSKLRGEQHVRRLFGRMPTYVLRLGNVYGYSRSMRFDAVVNRFVFEANFARRISVHGTGTQSRPFIHIDSVARVLEQTAFIDLPSGTYNLFDRNYTIGEIADVLQHLVPELEFLYINQHLSLRDLKADPSFALRSILEVDRGTSLEQDLSDFMGRFSF